MAAMKLTEAEKADLELLRPWLSMNDLVVCEEDYLVENNRWFYTRDAKGASNVIKRDFDLLMVRRTASTFKLYEYFTDLKRVKLRRIFLSELKQFERMRGLEHLEIDVLGFHKDATIYMFDPFELPALKKLLIRKFDPNLTTDVRFDSPRLEAVYFGDGTRLKFLKRESITHCEFVTDILQECRRFPNLQILVCHRLFHSIDLQHLGLVTKIMSERPSLTELHCNYDGLTSLTDDYGYLTDARVLRVFKMLGAHLEKVANPNLRIYIQGIPADKAGLKVFEQHGFVAPPFVLQHALIGAKKITMETKAKVYPSFIKADFGTIMATVPRSIADPNFLEVFSFKFPNVQELNISALKDEYMTMSQMVPLLQALRAVQKLTFNYSNCMPDFFSAILPNLPSLAESLVILRIYEAPRKEYASMSLHFLKSFRHLRYFQSNLICRDTVRFALPLVANYPFTFSLLYEYNEVIKSTLIIEKSDPELFQVTVVEDNTVTTERFPLPTRPQVYALGCMNFKQLILKLDDDRNCRRLLRHPFDRLTVEITERLKAKLFQSLPPELRVTGGRTLALSRPWTQKTAKRPRAERSEADIEAAKKRLRTAFKDKTIQELVDEEKRAAARKEVDAVRKETVAIEPDASLAAPVRDSVPTTLPQRTQSTQTTPPRPASQPARADQPATRQARKVPLSWTTEELMLKLDALDDEEVKRRHGYPVIPDGSPFKSDPYSPSPVAQWPWEVPPADRPATQQAPTGPGSSWTPEGLSMKWDQIEENWVRERFGLLSIPKYSLIPEYPMIPDASPSLTQPLAAPSAYQPTFQVQPTGSVRKLCWSTDDLMMKLYPPEEDVMKARQTVLLPPEPSSHKEESQPGAVTQPTVSQPTSQSPPNVPTHKYS